MKGPPLTGTVHILPIACLAGGGCLEPFPLYTLFSDLLLSASNKGQWVRSLGAQVLFCPMAPFPQPILVGEVNNPQNPTIFFLYPKGKKYKKEMRLEFLRRESWSAQGRWRGEGRRILLLALCRRAQ